MNTCIIAHSTVPSTRISREQALSGESFSATICMGMSLQYDSNVCLYLHHCYYTVQVVCSTLGYILCCDTIGLLITNNNQQIRRKDKRSMSFVCFLSLLYLLFPNTTIYRLLCLVLFVLGKAGSAQILTNQQVKYSYSSVPYTSTCIIVHALMNEIHYQYMYMSKLHTETVPAQHNTRHKANGRQTDGRQIMRRRRGRARDSSLFAFSQI